MITEGLGEKNEKKGKRERGEKGLKNASLRVKNFAPPGASGKIMMLWRWGGGMIEIYNIYPWIRVATNQSKSWETRIRIDKNQQNIIFFKMEMKLFLSQSNNNLIQGIIKTFLSILIFYAIFLIFCYFLDPICIKGREFSATGSGCVPVRRA